jgi:lipoate-protein ligase A
MTCERLSLSSSRDSLKIRATLDIRQEPAQAGDVLMAADAAFLEEAASGEQGALLRFYEWTHPTVSLGFHQSEKTLDDEAMQREGISWVRRPTGGAAVLHSQELTYCLILPKDHPFQVAHSMLEHTGRALAAGLRALGIDAELAMRGHPRENLPDRTSCFVRVSRWEVCVHGKKIVGSAQRFLHGALLQHGSILCRPDHLRLVRFLRLPSPQIRQDLLSRLQASSTSIAEELGRSVDMTKLRQAMAKAFCEEFASLQARS